MEIDWGSVKTEYEEGKETLERLVERYGTSDRTLRRRAAKGGWVRKKVRRLRKKPDEPDHNAEPEDMGLIQVHRTLWKDVKKRLKKGLKKKDVKSGLDELKVAKMAGEVLTNVIKGERLAWGLSDDGGGQPCEADAIAVEMDEVTASCGADEAVDGQ
ncbi:MAG: hypothetical protein HY886_07140 [Deltaproteobacteria bacterium]|nr:hypothetical protein [Deltaproteobacteria bacterium]